MTTDRLDKVMAARGMASSRERAQLLIASGLVQVDGKLAEKPGLRIEETADIVVTGEALPYVGRGGVKLEAALRQFRINAQDAVCLDVGASTGGFTDCLLQRGARRVVAVDVGHGQMAPSLQDDPRVELREGVNARYLSPEQFPDLFDLATIDVSFISLTLVIPAVAPLVRAGGYILAMVKPEFEAGREAIGARGIVRDPQARQRALDKIVQFADQTNGLQHHGSMRSPLTGGSGNREFIACLRRTPISDPEPEESQE